MAKLAPWQLETIRVSFTPDAVDEDQEKHLFRVFSGDRVLWAGARKITLADESTDSYMTLGDWDNKAGYITARVDEGDGMQGDLNLQDGFPNDLVDGSGAYLQRSGGKLYTRDDRIYVNYYEGTRAGTTLPVVQFQITLVRHDWPALGRRE